MNPNYSARFKTFNPELIPSNSILTFDSAVSVGGAATEAMTVTGLLATDKILAVTQSVKGAANLPLLGYNTQVANGLTAVWSATPGAGAVIKVTVLRG